MLELAGPAFPGDDGSPDLEVRARLREDADPIAVARALRGTRLLACVIAVADRVIAVADRVDAVGADKDSHMAVVSMVAADGRRGLLAFTGVDALHAWDPTARPVPAFGRDIARAALLEGAEAVVVDVAGPCSMVLEARALTCLADELDLMAVEAAVRECLASDRTIAVLDVRAQGREFDVLVVVGGPGEPVARALSSRADLAELVPGGLGVTSSEGDPQR